MGGEGAKNDRPKASEKKKPQSASFFLSGPHDITSTQFGGGVPNVCFVLKILAKIKKNRKNFLGKMSSQLWKYGRQYWEFSNRPCSMSLVQGQAPIIFSHIFVKRNK